MSVSWILKDKGRKVLSLLPNATLHDAVQTLASNRIGAIVIADDNYRIQGIISERDIVRIIANHGAAALNDAISKHMSKPVMSCAEHHTIDWVMTRMTENRFRHMPVADDGRLVGIISIGDVVKYKIAIAEAEADQMKQYFAAG